MKKIVVFPGWGYPADFYNFLEEIFEEVEILSGYKRVEKEITADCIIGWSMGAINFFLNFEKVNAKKIILISPTFNFMKSVKAAYIRAMIRKIKSEKEELLKEFYSINFYDKKIYEEFLKEYLNKGCLIENDELENGLRFLMNSEVTKKIEIKSEVIVLCGEKDLLIPYKNSLEASEQLNAEFILFKDTGHNIISERREELIELLRR